MTAVALLLAIGFGILVLLACHRIRAFYNDLPGEKSVHSEWPGDWDGLWYDPEWSEARVLKNWAKLSDAFCCSRRSAFSRGSTTAALPISRSSNVGVGCEGAASCPDDEATGSGASSPDGAVVLSISSRAWSTLGRSRRLRARSWQRHLASLALDLTSSLSASALMSALHSTALSASSSMGSPRIPQSSTSTRAA